MATASTIWFVFLALIVGCASSVRILVDEAVPDPPVLVSPPGVSLPSGTGPAGGATAPAIEDESVDPPLPEAEVPDAALPPAADVEAPVVAPPVEEEADPPVPEMPEAVTAPVAAVVPGATATSAGGAGAAPVATGAATLPSPGTAGEPQLSFYMHDIIGGSHPSARIVTGIVTSTEVNAVPFSKPTNIIFPFGGGSPLLNGNNLNNLNGVNLNGIINNNNLPYLTGFNGAQVSTVIQNSGNGDLAAGGDNQPFVTAGQLPAGATLQKLMFGTITVVDDELTEGHELGSGVLGKAQGFYLASSLDGTSQTMALTLLFHDGKGSSSHEVEDTISLFGVHRTASPESQVAIIGGTGKYEHAKGYATVETLHQEDQHTTDGVDTILHFSVYFSE
ncbi:dirigent protein 24-like [Punica granatum]|uniref:Dirigent protein n=1 Tax=Punica granatum TaxID=22663 RepID=A0A6P8BQS4_PUNGR|nr:dirigent protein 24-like [Punica granatum]